MSEEAKEKLVRLRARRRGHRGVCTKLEKEAIELLQIYEETRVERSEVIVGQLEEKLKVLNEIDEQILNICDVNEIQTEIEESAAISDRILNTKRKLERYTKLAEVNVTKDIEPVQENIENENTNGNVSNSNMDSSTTMATETVNIDNGENIENTSSHAVTDSPALQEATITNVPTTSAGQFVSSLPKLPKLELPKFGGKVTDWNSFWDLYNSSIHSNPTIAKVNKFSYLQSLLEGQAARAIKGLTLTGANYDAAIAILRDRFGKAQPTIAAHMDEILKIQACTSGKTSQLRYVYDKISVHVRGLASIGVSSKQYGSMLIPIIMSKLPTEIRLEIARKSTGDVWEIDELLESIKIELEAREVSEGVQSSSQVRKPGGLPYSPRVPSTSSLTTQDRTGKHIQCVYCKEFHFSASCDRVINPNDRKDILRRDNRCFICLGIGHRSTRCESKKSCRRCHGKHHQSICEATKTSQYVPPSTNDNKPKPPSNDCVPPTTNETSDTRTVTVIDGHKETTSAENLVAVDDPAVLENLPNSTTTTTAKSRNKVLLQTAVTQAQRDNGSNSIPVRVLLDSGSQRSYITNSLKKRLGLVPIRTETLNLNTFGEDHFKKRKCDVVQLDLKGSGGNRKITALCFPKLCSPLTTTIDISLYPHLHDLQLSDLNILEGRESDSSIDILLGADYYFDILTGEMVRGESGPVAINSDFGWVVTGTTNETESCSRTSAVNLLIEEPNYCNSTPTEFAARGDDSELSNSLRRFWEIESMGITEKAETKEEFLKNIRYVEGESRYEVRLPWKAECLPKSNGYSMCLKRLHQLKSRLDKNKTLLEQYDQIFKEQEKSGIIAAVVKPGEPSHYLPHHGVLRQDKETTKLRVVFDGSAKSSSEDLSLNDCLEKGPNLVPHLFDTVVNFRGYPIGLVADVEKAFHQIQIAPEDRPMLKFLWFEDITQETPTLKEYEFRRLPFGLTPSPAILSSAISHHLSNYKEVEPDIVAMLLESMYVDDFAGGASNDDQALRVHCKSQELMSQGGFIFRKWHSNSAYVRDYIAAQDDCNESTKGTTTQSEHYLSNSSPESTEVITEAPGADPMPKEPSSTKCVKVLGIGWNEISDEICYDLSELVEYAKSLPSTKRSVLKLSAKIFDPIGLFTPFTVTMKMLFQTLCTTSMNWDDELDGRALASWNSILGDLQALSDIRVPRCYFRCIDEPFRTHEIHGFCDASDLAYAAVVYLRTEHSIGEVDTNLIASKTRIAPIKKQTIPRLELLGANVLARLVDTVIKALTSVKEIAKVILWTDSFTTLCWIRNHKVWKTYVQNRVNEIRQLTSNFEWRPCPGHLNPADLPSRGCSGPELARTENWLKGPEFLRKSKENWPRDPLPSSSDHNEAYNEMMKIPTPVVHSLSGISLHGFLNIEEILDPQRYSTKLKLLRVTAFVIRFIRKCKRHHYTHSTDLTADELLEAERIWIRRIQSKAFADEIECLKGGRMSARVKQLGLYFDENNIIRCDGRISNSNVPDEAKRPILLPPKHEFTRLIIHESHELVHHNGVRDTLNCVRGKYWVLRGRESVKGVVRRCVTCKRFEAKPFAAAKTPPLPSSRVDDDPPFSNTGVDFAGPLYAATKQESEKVYICLFTCASTRAVHLELVPCLSVPLFLQAFRRFVARRGMPTRLITDNAKTFKGASKEVEKILRSSEIQREIASKGIKWDFIIEKAPWQGGFYERMIQSTKRCLKKILGRSCMNFESLRTLLVEIETTINNRPLTYVYDDEEGISYPLTPSQLVYGRQISLTPSDRQFDIISTNQALTKRAKNQRRLLQQFTKRWRNEYLLSLRETARVLHGPERQVISVGDVVVLKNDSTSRMFWKLARVKELIESTDGVIRAAKVCVLNSGKGRVTELRRPIQHLVPLELRLSTDTEGAVPRASEDDRDEENEIRQRPRRTAAVIGELVRKGMS